MDWSNLQKNLEARGFSVRIFDTGEAAADYLADAIRGKTVGFGGSMTLDRLVRFGEFPGELLPVLRCLVRGRYSILISGATNSGKSSLLNALGEYIGRRERLLTIEDSAELQLFHVENLVRLETRDANAEGMNEISMKDLIKAE